MLIIHEIEYKTEHSNNDTENKYLVTTVVVQFRNTDTQGDIITARDIYLLTKILDAFEQINQDMFGCGSTSNILSGIFSTKKTGIYIVSVYLGNNVKFEQ